MLLFILALNDSHLHGFRLRSSLVVRDTSGLEEIQIDLVEGGVGIDAPLDTLLLIVTCVCVCVSV
jgi:hypothetical protein